MAQAIANHLGEQFIVCLYKSNKFGVFDHIISLYRLFYDLRLLAKGVGIIVMHNLDLTQSIRMICIPAKNVVVQGQEAYCGCNFGV